MNAIIDQSIRQKMPSILTQVHNGGYSTSCVRKTNNDKLQCTLPSVIFYASTGSHIKHNTKTYIFLLWFYIYIYIYIYIIIYITMSQIPLCHTSWFLVNYTVNMCPCCMQLCHLMVADEITHKLFLIITCKVLCPCCVQMTLYV